MVLWQGGEKSMGTDPTQRRTTRLADPQLYL